MSFQNFITQIARRYSNGDASYADDIAQHVTLTLLEKGLYNDHDDYNLSYRKQAAKFAALMYIRSEWTYSGYNQEETFDTEGYSEIDYATDEISLENLVEVRELARKIRALSGREGEVVSMVIKGFSTSEIAEKLAISNPAVSIYKKRAFAKVRE